MVRVSQVFPKDLRHRAKAQTGHCDRTVGRSGDSGESMHTAITRRRPNFEAVGQTRDAHNFVRFAINAYIVQTPPGEVTPIDRPPDGGRGAVLTTGPER